MNNDDPADRRRLPAHTAPLTATDTDHGEQMVELRLPARPGLIGVVRHLAADLAERAGWDWEAIADLRMAVDEAVTLLATRATAEVVMRCRFLCGTDRLEAAIGARISATTATAIEDDTSEDDTSVAEPVGTRGASITTTASAWRVMDSLVDELHLHIEPPPYHRSTGSGSEGLDQRVWAVIRMIKLIVTTHPRPAGPGNPDATDAT